MENNKKYINKQHRFIEEYLQTMQIYLDDKQHKNFYRVLELSDRVNDLDNEIKELENEHLELKDKQLNIEIGLYELKKRIANKELAKEANIVELEKTIIGK